MARSGDKINGKVVECVIDCAKFLAAEMFAFWGNDSYEGKFISLFKLLAKRICVQQHICQEQRRHTTKERKWE